jgi:anti-anti-sigma factor
MDQFKLEWLPQTRDGIHILKVTGPFTLAAVFDFQSVIREDSSLVTLIDLHDVPYMDSAALGSLLGFHVSCQRESRKYALVGVADRLKTLFRVAGVDGMLSVYPTAGEAETALQAGA